MRVLALLATLSTASAFAPAPRGPRVRTPPTPAYVRDAERKHGRVALLALPTLLALSTVDPDPASYLARQPVDTQLLFFSVAGILEAASLPRLGPRYALRVSPGNYPPLKPMPALDAAEDAAGRAAMLGVTAFLLTSFLASA